MQYARRVLPQVTTQWLGRVHYEEGLRIQQQFVDRVKAARRRKREEENSTGPSVNYLLLLEHHPVYTVGIRGDFYSREEEARLRALGADFCRTNRGGMLTFHGPGQLVAYPILNLHDFVDPVTNQKPLGVRSYVRGLEQTVIGLVAESFGLSACTCEHTGVWVGLESARQERKVAAIGVRVSQATTSHGVALNCNTDLAWFNASGVVPCGVPRNATSLSAELARDVPVRDVLRPFVKSFEAVFRCETSSHDSETFDSVSHAVADV